jgi:hypothetical protein
MNQADKQALETISAALEPNARITRHGYAMLEQVIQHVASRLAQLEAIEKEKSQTQESQQ